MSDLQSCFAELSPRDRTALGLLALRPLGVRAETLDLLFRIAGLDAGQGSESLRAADLRRRMVLADLELAEPLPQHFAVQDPLLRRLALDWLVSSGLAARWVSSFNAGQINRLWSSVYYMEIPPQIALGVGLALLGGASVDQIRQACARLGEHLVALALEQAARSVLVEPIDDVQVDRLHPTIQLGLGVAILNDSLHQPHADMPIWLDRVRACVRRLGIDAGQIPVLYQLAWLSQDEVALQEALPKLSFTSLPGVHSAHLMASAEQALVILRAAHELQPVVRGSSRLPLPGFMGVVHALALAISADKNDQTLLGKLARLGDARSSDPFTQSIMAIHEYAQLTSKAQPWRSSFLPNCDLVLGWVQLVLCRFSGTEVPPLLLHWAQGWLPLLRSHGWTWLAAHFAAVAETASEASTGTEPSAPKGVWLWREPELPWQRALRAIEGYARVEAGALSSERYARIRVELGMHSHNAGMLFIEVRELKPLAKGGYSSGRRVEVGKPVDDVLTRLDPDDQRARALLSAWARMPRNYDDFFPLNAPLLDELFDYPYVYSGDEQIVRLVRAAPRLRIRRLPSDQVRVHIEPPPPFEGQRRLHWLPGQLQVTDYDQETLRLARALGNGTEFPESEMGALLALTPQLGRRIEVDADIGNAETVDHLDTSIHILVESLREGLRLRLRTRPLGEHGVYFVPAAGAADILGLREGKPVRGQRQLAEEQRVLDALLLDVPMLAGSESGEPLDLPDPEVALETLSHLLELGDRVTLDWANQKRWAVSRTQNSNKLALKVRSQRDWFAAEGGLTLDDGQVVSLATLLEALPSSQGRFVRLAGDQVVALSQELSRQLRQIRALADDRGRLQLAPAAVSMLQPLLDSGAQVDTDEAFDQQLGRIAGAADVRAEVPSGLQAELRDYQIEGYRWLMRLASWGAGACLADDMGLGKTLQALAVLLARSGQGPALVIAPTSVVPNWRNEARRFAPSLDVRIYGEGNRSQALEDLGPGSLLLVSYGLLTLNIESFTPIRFATLVLDEAQAIKNAAAQRSQAIRQLQADFRIATTGTPIENHLGELWSLMRVLNPGLLGSQEHFGKRFMTPIELAPRGPERDALRRLISPFMLRRLKSQVLTELPPRTEIVITVQPSEGEARLLAAVRKQAIERISAGETPEEAKRFHVLAEIMRLRRAACHPSLVAPELNLTGAKLEQLLELVAELKENRHRALVFSQFVDYLDIVRAAFDEAGISYQYLDGSTSSKAREAAVSAFQGGQGDVFLLSLKAGGVGLNLTAADYVIHLDPWWNPAVEQQATDRAHRIGQTRPVTVYKLVVAGSIEEQILALHGNKREIADSVLADQDGGTRLSVSELVGLLEAEL